MVVTERGIPIDVRLLQSQKVNVPMVVTELDIPIDVRLLQE